MDLKYLVEEHAKKYDGLNISRWNLEVEQFIAR
jgi:hypothetical protein